MHHHILKSTFLPDTGESTRVTTPDPAKEHTGTGLHDNVAVADAGAALSMLLGLLCHVIVHDIKADSCFSAYWQSMPQQLNMVKA